MVSKTVTIEAPNGMHARPVSALVALVKASGQQVTLRTPAKSVSGASMIGILSLGLKKGSEVEVAVEGDVHDRTQPKERADNYHERQNGERLDIGAGDRYDAAEQEIREVARCVARAQAHEQYADSHTYRPDDADGRILPDTAPVVGPFDPQCREDGEDHRAQNRIDSEVESDAQSAERGVRDAAAEEDQPPADDVSTDNTARNARQDARPKSVIEVAVSDKVVEKLHGALIISLQIYGFFTKK